MTDSVLINVKTIINNSFLKNVITLSKKKILENMLTVKLILDASSDESDKEFIDV